MAPQELLQGLKNAIEGAVKNYTFIAQYQADKKISVYIQRIPTENFQAESFYPLILIELLSTSDEVEGSTADILLTVGVHNPGGDAWLDLINLIETLRQFLLVTIIDNKFIPVLPLYTGIVEKRSDNFDFANIFITYQIPSVAKYLT